MLLSSKSDAFLLVEGKNEFHVISALCQKHNIPETFEIRPPKIDGGGIERLLENFRLQLRSSAGDRRAIGVVVDTDDIPDRRWQQVTNVIGQMDLGYVLPNRPAPQGTIIAAPATYRPRLGIWLMPDNRSLGDLEDFVRFLIPAADELPQHANNILDEIERNGLNRYGRKRSKAFIHTWLAWQKEPGLPMGSAITAKALSENPQLALTFINWLNQLFNV